MISLKINAQVNGNFVIGKALLERFKTVATTSSVA